MPHRHRYVEDEPRTDLFRDLRDRRAKRLLLRARRKAAACDQIARAGRQRSDRFKALALLKVAQGRPREDEAILMAGRNLVDREAFARHPGDRNHALREAERIEAAMDHVAVRPAGRVDGRRVAAQNLHDPRDVDPAAARIESRRPAPELMKRPDALRRCRDVERRVHRQRRDGMHSPLQAVRPSCRPGPAGRTVRGVYSGSSATTEGGMMRR